MELLTCGPITTIQLWIPRGVQTTLPPIDTVAEISTTAGRTLIQEGLATSLGLQPIGTTILMTTTTLQYEAQQYVVRLMFPAAKLAFEVMVAEVPYMPLSRASERIRCLIGQDILQYACLTYDGPAQTYSLTFQGVPNEQRDSSPAAKG